MIFLRKFDTAEDKAEPTMQYPSTNYVQETDVVAIEVSAPTPPGPHDYSQDYFTLNYTTAGTFKMPSVSVDYSTNDGQSWTTLASNTVSPSMAAGTKVRMKRVHGNAGLGRIITTGQFEVEGNAMSLVYGDNFTGQTSLTGYNLYDSLLNGSTGLTSAANLVLPATTLVSYCYNSMFADCTSLTTAPELPATTLTMGCYSAMFTNCTSLTTAPALPATTLADFCYHSMFADCTSLTTAPALPATALTVYCYNSMFADCTSLTGAPDLPAETLADFCYQSMFSGCTSLNYIKMTATDINASSCLQNWVDGVAATGTFIKKAGATIPSGTSGIPNGWTVQEV